MLEKVEGIQVSLSDVYMILDQLCEQGTVTKQDLRDAMNFLYSKGKKRELESSFAFDENKEDEELKDKLKAILDKTHLSVF